MEGQRKFGYSRDQRFDGVPGVMAWIGTPEGFPLAYEVLPGNTSDPTTRADFLKKIEARYGKAHRTWVMDRGIPTEETRAQRRAESPVYYRVGTPRGRWSKLEQAFLPLPGEPVRDSVEVKWLDRAGELSIWAKSAGRAQKERSMRRRRWKKLLKRLHELQPQKLTRDELLLQLGAAQKEAGRASALVDIHVPEKDPAVTPESFTFSLNRAKLRLTRRRDGHYRLRSHLSGEDPAQLGQYYLQLTEVEQALAPGRTPRAVLEKFSAIHRVDVHLPTTDGRHLILPRYTPPEPDHKILLQPLKLELPAQPPPKISSNAAQAP